MLLCDDDTVTSARRVANQGQELHLEGFTAPMDVNNRSDISGLRARIGSVVREHHAIVFFQHPASSADARDEARLPRTRR